MVMRPVTVMVTLEAVTMRKGQVAELEVAEIKMLRCLSEVTRMRRMSTSEGQRMSVLEKQLGRSD